MCRRSTTSSSVWREKSYFMWNAFGSTGSTSCAHVFAHRGIRGSEERRQKRADYSSSCVPPAFFCHTTMGKRGRVFVRLHHRLWLHREVSRFCLPSALVNTLHCYCQDRWVREVIIITHKLPRANLNFAWCLELQPAGMLFDRTFSGVLKGSAKRTALPDDSYARERERERRGEKVSILCVILG